MNAPRKTSTSALTGSSATPAVADQGAVIELAAASTDQSNPHPSSGETTPTPAVPRKTRAARKPAPPAADPVPKATTSQQEESVDASADDSAEKLGKPKKSKLVRDSFTMPKVEYGVIDELKGRAASLGMPVKKSELLRAGIKALAAMGDAAFIATLGTVPTIKTGRPKSDKL
jgi:hypothetical protein